MSQRVAKHAWIINPLLAILALIGVRSAVAVDPQPEYKIKGAYLYNFSRLVILPETRFRNDNRYNLCIVGASPFGDILTPLEKRKVGEQLFSLTYLHSEKELANCEMLFISRSEKRKLNNWLQQSSAYNILTVSDIDNFAYRGGMIGLITTGKRVKFEINNQVARNCNIEISAKLLELGRIVNNGLEEKSECRQ